MMDNDERVVKAYKAIIEYEKREGLHIEEKLTEAFYKSAEHKGHSARKFNRFPRQAVTVSP